MMTAGVLTRLVSQDESLAEVAWRALEIMHLEVNGSGGRPVSLAGLKDQSGEFCVAACYRCLMSYYNQPDHEILDRRDEDARAILLRLARARATIQQAIPPRVHDDVDGASSLEATWIAEAVRRGIPTADPEPLIASERSVRWVWRRHYVAVIINEADCEAIPALEDVGFDVVRFQDATDWRPAFAQLASALGLAP